MKQSLCIIQSSLPEDISLQIALSLEEPEVCALGCCSRFWRNLCRSDSIWKSLTRQRWPLLLSVYNDISPQNSGPSSEGWRGFYMKRHNEMANGTTDVVKYVEQCMLLDSIEGGNYRQAIEDLNSMHLGFKDVQMFLFKPKLNALLNLVGLHYCIYWLNVPPEDVMEALQSCEISDRKLGVKWWRRSRRLYAFRRHDECHPRLVSLADLATAKEVGVLGVLHRGAIHQVLQVQISLANSSHTHNP